MMGRRGEWEKRVKLRVTLNLTPCYSAVFLSPNTKRIIDSQLGGGCWVLGAG